MNQRERILSNLRKADCEINSFSPDQAAEHLVSLRKELGWSQCPVGESISIQALSNRQQHAFRLSLYAAYQHNAQGVQSAYNELCDFIENGNQNRSESLSNEELTAIYFMATAILSAIGSQDDPVPEQTLDALHFWLNGQYTNQGGDRHARI